MFKEKEILEELKVATAQLRTITRKIDTLIFVFKRENAKSNCESCKGGKE